MNGGGPTLRSAHLSSPTPEECPALREVGGVKVALNSQAVGIFPRPLKYPAMLFPKTFLEEVLPKGDYYRGIRERFDKENIHQKIMRVFKDYQNFLKKVPNPTEEDTRSHLINPILDLLGFRYRTEKREGKIRYDYLLFADGREVAVLEAKASTRPLEKYYGQILEYADVISAVGGMEFIILTNGVRWRLYHVRTRPLIERYYEVDLFPLIEGKEGAETLTLTFYALFNAGAFPDRLRSLIEEGREWSMGVSAYLQEMIFSRIVTSLANGFRKFAIDRGIEVPSDDEMYEMAVVLLYRLLVISYAEDRGILPLENPPYFKYSLRALRNLVKEKKEWSSHRTLIHAHLREIFRLIDEGDSDLGVPRYNGGLFSPERYPLLERYSVPDSHLREALLLLSYDRDGRLLNYGEVSIKQMGTIYERLLEYRMEYSEEKGRYYLVDFKGKVPTRKREGIYFTPDEVVNEIVERTVGRLIDGILREYETYDRDLMNMRIRELRKEAARKGIDLTSEEERDGIRRRGNKRKQELVRELLREWDLVGRILNLKVLDPAAGSGHFLVNTIDYITERITEILKGSRYVPGKTYEELIRLWEGIAKRYPTVELEDIVKRVVLKKCIFGVDKNPLAAELAKVSLWLHTFTRGLPLSFLEHVIRNGDSIVGYGFRSGRDFWTAEMESAVRSLKAIEDLYDITIAEVEESERIYGDVRRKVEEMKRRTRIKYRFNYFLEFPHIYRRGGFDAVIGNPPYIRHERLKGYKKDLREIYGTFNGTDLYDSMADLYVYFYGRAYDLVKEGGYVGFITSNKWMRAKYGRKLRKFLKERTTLEYIHDLTGVRVFQDATVDPAVVVFRKVLPGASHRIHIKMEKPAREFHLPQSRLEEEAYLLVPEEVLDFRERIERAGRPLGTYDLRIRRGVLTGLDDVFIIGNRTREYILQACRDEEERRKTEELLKPVLKGEDIFRWGYRWRGKWLIVTFPSLRIDIEEFPALRDYLLRFGRERLEQDGKGRKKTRHRWFETQDTIAYHDEFLNRESGMEPR